MKNIELIKGDIKIIFDNVQGNLIVNHYRRQYEYIADS